jgi:hypothetical protein
MNQAFMQMELLKIAETMNFMILKNLVEVNQKSLKQADRLLLVNMVESRVSEMFTENLKSVLSLKKLQKKY